MAIEMFGYPILLRIALQQHSRRCFP